jgi:hypothetical protein
VVAAASDLGACVCEDDATVTDDRSVLLARVAERVAELEAERDLYRAAFQTEVRVCSARTTLLDEAKARVRVQAEQITALQEALRVARLAIDRAVWPRVRAKVDATLALAEGCAAPADEEEK